MHYTFYCAMRKRPGCGQFWFRLSFLLRLLLWLGLLLQLLLWLGLLLRLLLWLSLLLRLGLLLLLSLLLLLLFFLLGFWWSPCGRRNLPDRTTGLHTGCRS